MTEESVVGRCAGAGNPASPRTTLPTYRSYITLPPTMV